MRRIGSKGPRRSASASASAAGISVDALGNQGRAAVVLDIEVYVDNAAGRLPKTVETLLRRAQLFHTSAALSALTLRLALAAPDSPDHAANQDYYRGLLRRIPEQRVLAADSALEAKAAGLVATLPAAPPANDPRRRAWLHDALAFLTAAEAGMPLLAPTRASYRAIERAWGGGVWISY